MIRERIAEKIMVPVYKPYLPVLVKNYARDAINSGWISSKGIYVQLAEKKLRELFGYKYVILTSNGTTAMHLVAKALKYKHPNINSLYVPNNVYVAAWNAFLYDKDHYTLIPFDANLDTWCFDINSYKEYIENFGLQSKTHAMLVVHNISGIVNIPKLKRDYPELIIAEDNCEGFLGKHEGKYTGTESLCSAISFFGNKSVTAGEGGAFITNDEDIYLYIDRLHNQGLSQKRFIHNVLGYNYRMTNLQAAILFGQLMCIKDIVKKKKSLFDYYRSELKSEDIEFQIPEEGCDLSNWMFGFRIHKQISYDKAELFFNDRGIEIRPMFYPINKHEYLKNITGIMDIATRLNKECILLPSYPDISEKDREKVVSVTKKYIEEIKK